MRATALCILMLAMGLAAQQDRQSQEYAGEFDYSCQHVTQLAEATPDAKYSWRPAAGIRSFSEVFMHIAGGNLMLLGRIGIKQPGGLEVAPDIPTIQKWEKEFTKKTEVLAWLKRACDAVPAAWRAETPRSLARVMPFFGSDRSVYGLYLRILVHQNEHMGQLVAYARVNGIRPPWSKE